MKMICVQATTTAKRRKAILAVLKQYPELTTPLVGPLGQHSFVDYEEDEEQTVIDTKVRNESIVEQVASKMRACGCDVQVMTEIEFQSMDMGEPQGSA